MERQELEKLKEECIIAKDLSCKLQRAEMMVNEVNSNDISIKIRTPNFSTFDFVTFVGDELIDEIKELLRDKVHKYYDNCVNDFVGHTIDLSMFTKSTNNNANEE